MIQAPKKICILGISLGKGGAERSMALQSKILDNLGHQVHLVILTDSVLCEYSGELFNLGKLKNKKNSFLSRIFRFKKLRKYIKQNQFDYIIDNRPRNNYLREWYYQNYIYKGVTKIYVVHTSFYNNVLTNRSTLMKGLYLKNKLNVTVSNYIENEILNKNGIFNTVTIHNPFDAQWNVNNSTLPAVLKDKNYILSYGRLEDKIKDISFLIQSFLISNLWKKEIYLVIMGDGTDKEKLINIAKNSLASDYIIFLNYEKEPFSIIKNAKFTTLTSRYEGFPMVLVESLSLATPVVSLDIISGPAEIIQHKKNGLLVSGRNVYEFAKAMCSFFENENLYTDCKNFAKESVNKYSLESVSVKWDKFI